MRCECNHCPKHEGRCLNLDGQLSLLDNEIIQLMTYAGRQLCYQCLPKPPVIPVAYYYSNREAKRLAKQETLFLFL